DELQANLTRSVETGDSVSLLDERDFDAPSRVSLIEAAGGHPVLQLDTDFNRAWSSVGRALAASDIRVDDLDRSQGIYYVNLAEGVEDPDDQPGFFSRLFGGSKDDIEARAERYQVRLDAPGEGVQVTLAEDVATPAPADVARRVLNMLKDNLG